MVFENDEVPRHKKKKNKTVKKSSHRHEYVLDSIDKELECLNRKNEKMMWISYSLNPSETNDTFALACNYESIAHCVEKIIQIAK